MSGYLLHIFTMVAALSPALLGLTLLVGVAGLPLICAGAYVAVGAYAYAIITQAGWLSPLGALLPAVILAGLFTTITGSFFIAMKRDDFAIATVALQSIVMALLMNGGSLTGGSAGMPGVPTPPGGTLPWALGATAVSIAFFVSLRRRRIGLDLAALRDDERAAEALGINPNKTRLAILGFCGLLCGMSGALYAAQIGFIDPGSFSLDLSITFFAAVLLGGRGSWAGALLGCAFTVCLPELLRFSGIASAEAAAIHQILYGVCLLLIVRLRPAGLIRGV